MNHFVGEHPIGARSENFAFCRREWDEAAIVAAKSAAAAHAFSIGRDNVKRKYAEQKNGRSTRQRSRRPIGPIVRVSIGDCSAPCSMVTSMRELPMIIVEVISQQEDGAGGEQDNMIKKRNSSRRNRVHAASTMSRNSFRA